MGAAACPQRGRLPLEAAPEKNASLSVRRCHHGPTRRARRCQETERGDPSVASAPGQPLRPAADYPDRISRQTFEQLASVRGEGDEWDFKATLGNLASTSARVNLAKDALAFCNLPAGG